MHSRAFLLLRRDLVDLERFPIAGVVAQPRNDDLFQWNAKIEGLQGTVWEGGIFQVHISFTEDFNYKPPEVHFMTIPFHPNVDATDGSPSLPHGNWSEESSVSTLLLSLQALLSSPELDDPCVRNPAAARLLREAPSTYKQMALDCVTASLRVDAGLTPYDTESGGRTPVTPDLDDRVLHTGERRTVLKPVSFEDYYTLWKGIATSITGYKAPNDFANLLQNDKYLSHVHCRGDQLASGGLQHKLPIESTSLEQRVDEHIILMYGKSNVKRSVSQNKSRTQRIEQLKQMYRKGMDMNTPSASGREESGGGDGLLRGGDSTGSGAQGPDEVEKLLEWTNALDFNEPLLTLTPPL